MRSTPDNTVGTEKKMSDLTPMKPATRFVVSVAIVIVLLLGGGATFAYWLNEPPEGMPNSAIVTVAKGDSLRTVGRALNRRNLIRSWPFLDLVSKVTGTSDGLKAGRYKIVGGSTTLSIHNLLMSGRQLLVRVTIPDGWTLKQIADRLSVEKVVSKADFMAAANSQRLLESVGIPAHSAAGFLFPDTYLFPEDYTAAKVVQTMTRNFYEHLAQIYPDYHQLSGKQLLDKVIMASIVEREYRVPVEAPVIASVFYNRLKIGMRLQSCATVSYVLTDIKGLPHQVRLYDKDLKVQSPYNTYLHAGLPPGPISAPGTVALHAAFYPASTDYLYFVLKNPVTGRHFFSRSFAAHLMAQYQLINLYLKSD